MKIIDFEKKGNLVRFYLGDDDCEDYGGDDWNDRPYEHNAGLVYDEYIKGNQDLCWTFNYSVLEPSDGCINSEWSKDDMKARKVPCILVFPEDKGGLWDDSFEKNLGRKDAIKIYFGDSEEKLQALIGKDNES